MAQPHASCTSILNGKRRCGRTIRQSNVMDRSSATSNLRSTQIELRTGCVLTGSEREPWSGSAREKSCELYAAIIGVLKAGAAYVPIDPKFPAERIRSIVRDAGVKVVISAGTFGRNLQLGDFDRPSTAGPKCGGHRETLEPAAAPKRDRRHRARCLLRHLYFRVNR